MKVLHLAGFSLLSQHFMRGWRNAFLALGDAFEVLDPAAPDFDARVRSSDCDLILTASGEGIRRLPTEFLNERGVVVVVNGLPFNAWHVSPEIQAPCADGDEVRHLARLDRKLVWSQWSPEFVVAFFSGYEALGIPVLALPYAGDVTICPPTLRTLDEIADDLVFIGNLKHRRRGNLALFRRLLALTPRERIRVHGGADWRRLLGVEASPTAPGMEIMDFYRRALVSPNIHTVRQRVEGSQVNDRCFQIPAAGGFQICDTPLIRDFFDASEVVLAETEDDFVEKTAHYLRHPEETLPFSANAARRVRRDHSHFNRIAAIFEALGIAREVRLGEEVWHPFRYLSGCGERTIPTGRTLRYFAETAFMRSARGAKRWVRK